MSWRDRLFDASFRDVSFKVSSSDTKGGRRIKETDRWQQRTITLDEGPALVKFNIKAYIIQNIGNNFDYFAERDKLIDALNNKSEVGLLIHPYYGRLRVHAGEYSVTESFDNGGIAEFTIEFKLEEDQLFPGPLKDIKQTVDLKSADAINRGIDSFVNSFDTATGFIDRTGQDIVYGLKKIQLAVSKITGVVKSTLTTAVGIMASMQSIVDTLLNTPADLFSSIQEAVEAFGYLVGMKGDPITYGVEGEGSGEIYNPTELDGTSIPEELGTSVLSSIISAQDFDENDLGTTTSDQEENQIVVVNSFKFLLLLYACQVLARINFESQNSMQDIIDLLADAIDDFLVRLGDETNVITADYSMAIESVWFTLLELLQEKMQSLEKEIDYELPNANISALQLAYDLYNDLTRDEEIFNRNIPLVRHPGFLPANETIKVLET